MAAVLSATSIVGDNVRNAQGEDLGKIEDLMIDIDNADVRLAILSFGGVFGLRDKLFAVPLEAMNVDYDTHEFVLDVPRERLEEAPGFDKDDWPTDIGGEWGRNVYRYYEVRWPS